jgi:hypothetical protein
VSVRETETCVYLMRIQTPVACEGTLSSASGDAAHQEL